MGQQIVTQLLGALPKMDWPDEPNATAVGRQTYFEGIRRADSYADESDPKPLAEALRIFRSGQSRPYALAGVAYVLIAASQEDDGSYDQSGLDAALTWLEKAQELEPDLADINVLEGLIYTYGHRFDDARLILDYLAEADPDAFPLIRAETAFWEEQGALVETDQWYQRALAAAPEHRDRLRLQNRLADFYARTSQHEKAIAAYRQSLTAQQTDARLWHKLSQVHWVLGDVEEAQRCNQRSLANGSLPAAQEMAAQIRAHMEAEGKGKTGFLGRLGL